MKKVEQKDINYIKEIFSAYPFKGFQQQFQNIDKMKLSSFLTDNLLTTLNNENYESYFIPQKALLTMSKDKWHSSVYDMNMAKISNLIILKKDSEIYKLIMEKINNFINENAIQHLSCRLDVSDFHNIRFLLQNGFYYVGESVKMSLKITTNQTIPKSELEIVDYQSKYRNDIKRIARTAHSKNYFFYDPYLDNQKTSILFDKWTERCIDSLAEKVFVATKSNAVTGFLIFMTNKNFNIALNKKIAILDFMAVDETYKGMKIGSGLLAYFIDYIREKYDMIELRTMNDNFPAINLYQKFGFRIVSSDFIFHKYREH